jgi:hypothetical protein
MLGIGIVALQALLACFAKAAGAGEMLNVHDLKAGHSHFANPISAKNPETGPEPIRYT